MEAADRSTEKKAAAADNLDRYRISPVPLVTPNRPKPAPSRAVMQRIHWWSDWLAVDAVFCEPVSAANSLLNREFTGNFTVLRPVGGDRAQENLDQSAAYNQIPYAIEQGIIFKDQGIYSTEQGFFFAPQGKRDKRQLVAWFVLARGDAILAGRCHCVDEENTVGTSA